MRSTRRMRWRAALLVGLLAALGRCTASPATATFPGRDGRIAFADFITGQIYAVNPDGTGLAQLTHTDARHVTFTPEWTADGRLTFSLLRANTPDDHARIWIMNADGTDQHRLAGDAPGYRDYGATLTPDGRVVFARCKPDNGVCAIWIMRSDGTDKRPLTRYRQGQNEAIDFFPDRVPRRPARRIHPVRLEGHRRAGLRDADRRLRRARDHARRPRSDVPRLFARRLARPGQQPGGPPRKHRLFASPGRYARDEAHAGGLPEQRLRSDLLAAGRPDRVLERSALRRLLLCRPVLDDERRCAWSTASPPKGSRVSSRSRGDPHHR